MTMETPRPIVIYDMSSIPAGMDMGIVMDMFKKHGLLLYDSQESTEGRADAPQVLHAEDMVVSFVDVSDQEQRKKVNGYLKRLK